METVHGAPDVWQQLQQLRLGDPFRRVLELSGRWVLELSGRWTEHAATQTQMQTQPQAQPQTHPQTHPAAPEGVQLLGLFGSRFFLFAVLIGFVISRIHVLVHRPRVRALGAVARVALYAPVQVLLWRALAQTSVVLDAQRARGEQRWMGGAVAAAAAAARRRGVEATAGGALWAAFAATCVFDCVDVFVARLEGSPCAPYEFIGELVERTSLYYFYGASVRIQELALLGVVEKLLLGA
ncbi:hypothetical protein GGF43_005429, partial [Coemansia sp. RSA 2618]